MPDLELTGDDIRAFLREVAEQLPTGNQQTLVMVGGSLLAWHALRDSTRDVDSVQSLGEAMRAVVAKVGERHGLAPAWVNDSARPFKPQTLLERDCELLLEHPQLLVLGAPLEQVFLMKLHATRVRSRDYEDLLTLWPRCSFPSPQAVVDMYFEAYPLAASDEYLVDFVGQIAATSSAG